jgi:hypothetical protein
MIKFDFNQTIMIADKWTSFKVALQPPEGGVFDLHSGDKMGK